MNTNNTQTDKDSVPSIDQSQAMRHAYLRALDYIKQETAPTEAPTEGAEQAAPIDPVDVIVDLLTLLDGVALYGAAVQQLVFTTAEPGHEEQLKILKQGVVARFEDEFNFCKAIEHMTRHNLLVQAGIDPNDPEAVKQYFLAYAKNVMFSVEAKTEETK